MFLRLLKKKIIVIVDKHNGKVSNGCKYFEIYFKSFGKITEMSLVGK